MESTVNVLPTKIEIKLKKAVPKVWWNDLEVVPKVRVSHREMEKLNAIAETFRMQV